MLDAAVGFALGALATGVPFYLFIRTLDRQGRSQEQIVSDLHDRLAAKTWPEYKAFAEAPEPAPDPHAGLVWDGDDTGMYGQWIRPGGADDDSPVD